MRSMTGFGVGRAPCPGGVVCAELRSVNHRFFELKGRAEGPLADRLHALEESLRTRLARGRVDVVLRLEANRGGAADARLEALVARLTALRDRHAPGEPLPWPLLIEWQRTERGDGGLDDETAQAVDEAVSVAAGALDTERLREGAALAAELAARLDELLAASEAVRLRLPQIVERHRDKLRRRLDDLLGARRSELSEGRLELEVALLADRMDVAEELSRLGTHVAAFRAALSESAPVGRKLDFLTQELLREVNTLGSKVADAEVTTQVVAMKTTLERMREQVQNVL